MKEEAPVTSDFLSRKLNARNVFFARQNLLSVFPKRALHEPIISGSFLPRRRWHLLMSPPDIARVLQTNQDNYPKSFVMRNLLRPYLGDGLLLAENASWRRQRQVTAPVFVPRHVKTMTPLMMTAAENASQRIAHQPEGINIFEEMLTASLEIIASVTFARNNPEFRKTVEEKIRSFVTSNTIFSFADVMGIPGWVPRPGWRQRRLAIKEMQNLADRIIVRRLHQIDPSERDFLDLLIAGDPQNGSSFEKTDEIRNNLLTFIIAGHITTALAMSWTLYLLAFDQEAQSQVFSEVAELNKSALTSQDLPALDYTQSVLKEALRLYPPVSIVSRVAQKADILAGQNIRAGEIIVIPIYILHRHRALWENPDHFDPKRFHQKTQRSETEASRYAYLPFLDGPRSCIGQEFALNEAKIMIATLIRRFEFSLDPAFPPPRPMTTLTLRSEGGIHLIAKPRA